MLTEFEIEAMIAAATAVRERGYVPYSGFAVGAALRAEDGALFTGCNVENASYGLTICAERNAVFQAVAAGARRFDAVAVVTGNGASPCGACRQVLAEFGPRMTVYPGQHVRRPADIHPGSAAAGCFPARGAATRSLSQTLGTPLLYLLLHL